jgi:hypothetical protein
MTKISVLLAAAPPSDGPCALRNRRRLRAGRGFRHRTPWRRGLSITGASSGKRRPGSCGALRSVRLARSSTPEPSVSCKTITSDPPLGRAAQGLGIPSRTVTVEAALSKRSAAADRDSLVVHSPVDMEGCVEPCGTVVSSRRSCPRARSTKPPTSVPVAIVSSPSEKLPVLSLTTPIR